MPIEQLPRSTVRHLCSSQNVPHPESIVRELIDNALDAKATSIHIDISANGLDEITVRDNGHGVAPSDRALLCQPNCTSKIRDLDDVKYVGPKSLGFRGVALASIFEAAAEVIVATRVAGEPVASLMSFADRADRQCRPISHPIGTTVKVVNLYCKLPVRRQAMLKGSLRHSEKLKKVLQRYALVNRSTRFALRVHHKTQSSALNWTLAPGHGTDMLKAATIVIGRDCINECELLEVEHEGHYIEALLPKTDAVQSAVNKQGAFVYVDSRIMSTQRGTISQVLRRLREKLNSCSESAAFQDPFCFLNIACPSGSYDVNVEPSKDAVIFERPQVIMEAVEELLIACYGSDKSVGDGGSVTLRDTSPIESTVGHEEPRRPEIIPTDTNEEEQATAGAQVGNVSASAQQPARPAQPAQQSVFPMVSPSRFTIPTQTDPKPKTHRPKGQNLVQRQTTLQTNKLRMPFKPPRPKAADSSTSVASADTEAGAPGSIIPLSRPLKLSSSRQQSADLGDFGDFGPDDSSENVMTMRVSSNLIFKWRELLGRFSLQKYGVDSSSFDTSDADVTDTSIDAIEQSELNGWVEQLVTLCDRD